MTDVVRPKIFVAVPSGRSLVTGQTLSSLVSLTRELLAHDMMGGFGTLAFPDVVEVRNLFTTIWYDKVQCSHMLFVDDDMGFDPQLVIDMAMANYPLVGALCPKRKLPIEFAGRAKPGECRIVNSHMEVEGVGGALMLIRRDCMDAILASDPGIVDTKSVHGHAAKPLLQEHGLTRLLKPFNKIVVDGEEFSEDLSFCLRWRRTGGDVWANIKHPVTHVGPHEYTGCFYDTIKDQVRDKPSQAPVELEAMALMAAE